MSPKPLVWAYGVTTVPVRIEDGLLRRTLASLALAEFDEPRLFVDGEGDIPGDLLYRYQVTQRKSCVKTFANWVLTAWELYLRNPLADRYAIFQDDFVTYLNLRQYLEKCEYPHEGYWNLYTAFTNEAVVAGKERGWHLSDQLGKGAVALVFDSRNLRTLLTSDYIVNRPMSANTARTYKSVDGAIVCAMLKKGCKEFVHYPSLVQHTGTVSSMQNKPQPLAQTFMGEEFNAMELLRVAV